MRAGHEPTLSAAASGAAPRKGCSGSRSAKRDSNKGRPRGQTRQRKQRRKAALLPLSSSLATWAHRCVVCEWYTHVKCTGECTGRPEWILLYRFLFYCLEMGLSLDWKFVISSPGQGHATMPGFFTWVPRTQSQILKPVQQVLLPTELAA